MYTAPQEPKRPDGESSSNGADPVRPDAEQAVRRVRLSRERRAEQLLDVAEQLFANNGLDTTTIEDVAAAAGVTKPVVYAHYASKESLYLACVERARRELGEQLRELNVIRGVGASFEQVLVRAGEIFFTVLERDARRWVMLFSPDGSLSSDLALQIRQLKRETIDQLVTEIRPFGPDVSDTQASMYGAVVSGVGEQLGRWWIEHPEVSKDTILVHYRDFIVRGLIPVVIDGVSEAAD